MTVEEALNRILAGSSYAAVRVGATAWRIEHLPRAATAPRSSTTPKQGVPLPPPPEPIIVSATKTPRDVQTLPIAIARIDLADKRRGLPDAGSDWIAAHTDGLSLTHSGPGRNRMFLRGVADSAFSGESQSTVAILLDNARVTYAAPDPDIRLVDVERVEVLKGPQGSLYGTGALGGIYQIRTNQPQFAETAIATSGGGQATAQGAPGYGGSIVVNLPIAEDNAALRVVGYSMDEGGWIDTGPRTNSNTVRVAGARAAIAAETDSGWRIDISGLAQRINADDSQYVYSPGARSRPAQLPEPHDNDITVVSALAAGPVGGMRLEIDSSHVWHEVRDTFDATVGAEAFGLADPQLLSDDRKYRIWNAEARLSGAISDIEWLLGLSRIEAKQVALVSLSSTSDSIARLDDDRRTSTETALFGNVRLPLGKAFAIEAGARLFAGSVQDTRLVAGDPVTRDLHRTGLTPSASLSWSPDQSRLVFLRYGSALRQGGVDIAADGALESYNSDELQSLEVGWRELLPWGGRLEIGAFATRWQDMQSDMLQGDGLIETMNVGDARILGLEASFEQDFGTFLHAELGGVVVDGKLVRDESGLELEDRRLPIVPSYTLRGSLRHDFAVGDGTATIGLGVRYVGPARLTFDPLLDRQMGDVIDGRVEGRIAIGRFEAGLTIDNLFGCDDDTFAFGNRLRIRDMEQFTPLRPTTATLSFGWKY